MTRLSLSRPLPPAAPVLLTLLAGVLAGVSGWLFGPLPIVALAGGLVLAVLIFHRPEMGALALIFISYTRFSDVLLDKGVPVSMADLLVLWLLVVLALRWYFYRETPAGWTRPAIFLGLYGLVGLLTLFYAPAPDEALAAVVDFAQNGILILLVVAGLQRPGALRYAVWVLLAAGLFLGLLSVYQQLSGNFTQTFGGFAVAEQQHIVGQANDYRIGGPLASPNFYAMILIPLLPLAVDRLWQEGNLFLRLVAGATFVIILLTIIFTYSRGGFLALAVVFGLLLWRMRHRTRLLIGLFLLLLLLLPLVPAAYRQRLATIPKALVLEDTIVVSSETAVRGRLSEWVVGYEMFRDHPVGGVGLANYPRHYLEYSAKLGLDSRREERPVHNLYLEIASETGLLGLAAFGMLLFAVIHGLVFAHGEFRRSGDEDAAGIIVALSIGLIGYLVASIFLHGAFPRFFWMLVAIAFAAPGIATITRRDRHL